MRITPQTAPRTGENARSNSQTSAGAAMSPAVCSAAIAG